MSVRVAAGLCSASRSFRACTLLGIGAVSGNLLFGSHGTALLQFLSFPRGGFTRRCVVIDRRPPLRLFGFSFTSLALFDDPVSSRLSVRNHPIQHLQAETANVHRVGFNLFRADS